MSLTRRANPGSPLAPEDVFGRDELIADLWDRLEHGSVLLSAERRIGKTSIIRKMQAEAPLSKLVYWHDVSGVATPAEFVQQIFEDVEGELSKKGLFATKARQLISGLGGEISGVKLPPIAALHWKILLERTIADLVEHCGRDVVFLWDEVPWMLEKIRDGAPSRPEGERLAMEVLDVLRMLRQTYPSLRMVLSGSIGLHHVISELREKGYRNAALNDLYVFEVPPHSIEDASELAMQLLSGEAIPCDDQTNVALAIAEGVGGVAFYVHHLVVALLPGKRRGQIASFSTVSTLLTEALEDDQDRWQFAHYRDRLPGYYGLRAALAAQILDEIASSRASVPLQPLLQALRAQNATVNPDDVRDLIDLLRRDHYITQNGGAYQFRYSLVERWWRLNRGLVAL